MESKRLNMMAQSTPFTLNPVMKLLARSIIIAFMTNKNSPKVTMVTGNVNMTKTGFTTKFKRLKTTATIIAVP